MARAKLTRLGKQYCKYLKKGYPGDLAMKKAKEDMKPKKITIEEFKEIVSTSKRTKT